MESHHLHISLPMMRTFFACQRKVMWLDGQYSLGIWDLCANHEVRATHAAPESTLREISWYRFDQVRWIPALLLQQVRPHRNHSSALFLRGVATLQTVIGPHRRAYLWVCRSNSGTHKFDDVSHGVSTFLERVRSGPDKIEKTPSPTRRR